MGRASRDQRTRRPSTPTGWHLSTLLIVCIVAAVCLPPMQGVLAAGSSDNVTPLAPICSTVAETVGLPIQSCFPPMNGNQSQALLNTQGQYQEIPGATLNGPKVLSAGACPATTSYPKRWCTSPFSLSVSVPGAGGAKAGYGFGLAMSPLLGTKVVAPGAPCPTCILDTLTFVDPTATWCPRYTTSCPSSSPPMVISGHAGVFSTMRVCAVGLHAFQYPDGTWANFTACLQIQIEYASGQTPPTATFTSIQDEQDPYTFAFDGSNSLAQAPGATIKSWSWNFGDGATANGPTVTHTFSDDGHFQVTLTVTDSNGQRGTYTVGLDVSGLVVRLDPGETNGKLFTVGVTITNESKTDLSDLNFVYPDGVVMNNAAAIPQTAGLVMNVGGPYPLLPPTLAAGDSVTSTVAFAVREKGGVDLVAPVSATDPSGKNVMGTTSAALQIGVRTPTNAELLQEYSNDIISASSQVGTLINSAQQRIGDVIDWATGASPGGGLPAWLTSGIANGTTPPSDATLPDVPGWKVLAARAAGLSDSALAWLPNDPTQGMRLYLEMEKSAALASASVLKNTALSVRNGLANAAQFYGQLSSGDPAFQAAASQQLQGLINDVGVAAAPKIELIGSIIAASHDDVPGSLGDFSQNPALQKFAQNSANTVDAVLKTADTNLVAGVQLAKTNPDAAADKIGQVIGSTTTNIALTAATSEFGGTMVSRFSKAVEGSVSASEVGASLDASATLNSPALPSSSPGAPLVSTGSRQTLESLGAETPITVNQLETLGGFYGGDATKVQQIVKDVKSKFGVDVEVQVRPGNPASLQYYANGTGVPKPEWIKPKATEWTDVLLGAPPDSLGKATLYEPVLPSASEMATFSEADQAAITARYQTQKDLYASSFDPNGTFQKLLADSATKEGATQSVGLGTSNVTGLHYSLQDIPGHPGAKYIIDDAAGGKYVLSDADYQAVVSAGTGRAIPAAAQRGQIELYVLNRFEKDTVSFGGHGWTVSGFDLPSQYSKPFLQFATGSMNPLDARSTLAWWLKNQTTQPKWIADLAKKLGHPVTVDDLMGLFSPGQFVIKFNGATMRVGYGATLGK